MRIRFAFPRKNRDRPDSREFPRNLDALGEAIASLSPSTIEFDRERMLAGMRELGRMVVPEMPQDPEEIGRYLANGSPSYIEADREKMIDGRRRLGDRYGELAGSSGVLRPAPETRGVMYRRRLALGSFAVVVLLAASLVFLALPAEKDVEREMSGGLAFELELEGLSGVPIMIPVQAEPEETSGEPEGTEGVRAEPAVATTAPVTESPGVNPESVRLSYYSVTGDGVSLSWNVSPEDSSYDGAVVLRSPPGTQPAFPSDQISPVLDASSFLDATVLGDRAYNYRVVLLESGEPVASSAEMTARVESQVDTTLSGSCSPDGVDVTWSTEILGIPPGITHYVLSRVWSGSKAASSPTRMKKTVRFDGGTDEFRDADLQPGTTYVYQISVCRGSEVLESSNEIMIQVPTTGE